MWSCTWLVLPGLSLSKLAHAHVVGQPSLNLLHKPQIGRHRKKITLASQLGSGRVLHCAVVWLWRASLGNTAILASAADHPYFSAIEHVFLSWIRSFPAGKLSPEFYYHSLTLGLSVPDSTACISLPANKMNSWT